MTIFAAACTWLLLQYAHAKTPHEPLPQAASSLEQTMQQAGLVNVQELDPNIQVVLKYATTDNLLEQNVYGDMRRCFLRSQVAQKVAAAQKTLRRIKPGWSLLVYDCTRPARVQKEMWNLVRGTARAKYLVSPEKGSNHNYGAAVDLTLVDNAGHAVDMGTPFDFFGDRAEPRHEEQLLKAGELTATQVQNRQLLRRVMTAAGFRAIPNEWWHFDSAKHNEIVATYPLIE
jgi:zinc D-Ala-D-Ala dipeptidase